MNIEKMILEEFELSKRQLKIHQVDVFEKESRVLVHILVKELISKEQVDSIVEFMMHVLKTSLKIEIKQIKNHCAEDYITQKVKKFISKESSFLEKSQLEGDVAVAKQDDGYIVTYLISERFASYYKTAIEEKLKKYLYRCFLEEIELKAEFVPEYEAMKTKTISVQEVEKMIEVTEIEKFIGDKVTLVPAYISEVDRPSSLVVVCGKIENVKKIMLKKPRKNQNDHFYTFTLADVSGKITCKIFQRKDYNSKMESIEDMEVILMGTSETNTFSKDIEIIAKHISACKIPEDMESPKEVSKKAGNAYLYVEPEELELYSQETLFETEEKEVSARVKRNRIVCFDLETTGLDPRLDTIIEIGAVEIVNGVITRKFSTLVDPQRKIAEIITKITGIEQANLVGQPKIGDVFQDFFKFCDGAVLCGHNSKGFDMKFIYEEASKQGYIFNHEVLDTLEIARVVVKGVKNYKLGTLCEHFGIDLTNAHRAYHDAIATAKLLLEIY